ncbi:MAG TPA: carboxypeptidase-like regulatory domain-containing protein [Candidatus Thermoplasmatota archaeon]|nr:carboxypeptidase-like regulatory domain-containing protein [Candidatus Thermoplasmatota archaeon]
MRVRIAVVALLAALPAIALAGCSGGGGGKAPDPTQDVDFGDLDLQATKTTGVIRGVVVDVAVRPVADVTVELRGGNATQQATSKADGAFGFDSLPPGDYFLTANKPGYIGSQQSTQVVAGLAEPPIVKILLEADPTTQPYVEVDVFAGFIECSVRPMILALQCGATDVDVVHAEYPLARPPEFIQSEMIWASTQAAGDELSLSIRCLPGDTDPAEKCPEGQRGIARSEGKSPQVARINRTLIDQWALGVNPLVIDLFAFGRSDLDAYNESTVDGAQQPVTGKPCMDWSGVIFPPGTCVRMTGPGLILNQKVDVYTHIFYGYKPPEGWQFSVDGDPPAPE